MGLSSADTPALIQASQLAQLTIDRAGEAVLWTDPAGHLLYANEAATRSLGYAASEIRALTVFDISPEFTEALWKELWKEIRAQKKFTFEFSLRARDRHVFPVEMDVHHGQVDGQ